MDNSVCRVRYRHRHISSHTVSWSNIEPFVYSSVDASIFNEIIAFLEGIDIAKRAC